MPSPASPIARGYGEDIALYSARGEYFKISDLMRRALRRKGGAS